MKLDIAETTDIEISEIIQKLKSQGHSQEDEACVRIETPFTINPGIKEDRQNRLFLALYPELLSYFVRERNPRKVGYVTIPWICCRFDILAHHQVGEKEQREICKWMVKFIKEFGYTPFHDEDAFCGYFSREVHQDMVTFKMYINPDFPEGYWSNHTL